MMWKDERQMMSKDSHSACNTESGCKQQIKKGIFGQTDRWMDRLTDRGQKYI